MAFQSTQLVSKWQTVKLAEICNTITDGTHQPPPFTSEGVPFLFVRNIVSGQIDFNVEKYVSQETYKELTRRHQPLPGDLLFSAVGSFGVAVVVDTDRPFIFQRHIALIKPKRDKIDPYFLALYLNSPGGRQQSEITATGASQRTVTLQALAEFKIPLPPLAEQKWIAAIAQKADRLRRTRRYALKLSDTYLRSVFLEMFGDQQSSYERMTLSEVCLKIFDCKHYTPPYVPEGIPLIKTNDVVPGFFQFGNTVYVSLEEYEKLTDVNKPEQRDIVFAREGSFGVASYIADNLKYAIGQRMMLLRADQRQVNPIYLTHFLNSPSTQDNLLKVSMGTTVQRVNVGDVKDLPILIPPLPLQEKFAQIVHKFERLRTQQREASRQAEHLFQTLLHRAFRGELTSQHANDEPASVLLEEISAQQAQAEAEAKAATQAMGDAAEYLGTKAKQQDTEPIQLTLPGLE